MSERRVLLQSDASASLFADLDSRSIAVWLLKPFFEAAGAEATAKILSLPWSMVLSEASDKALVEALEVSEPPDSALVRRRGIIHVVDKSTDTPLPPRSLPVFLLGGRGPARSVGLAALTRRLTMLDELKRRAVSHLVILAGPGHDAR